MEHHIDKREWKDEAGGVSSDPIGKDHTHLAKKFAFLHKGNGKATRNFNQKVFMARSVL